MNDELPELTLQNSVVELEFDKENRQFFSKVIYHLDRQPSQAEQDIIIEETAGQLADGFGSVPWRIKTPKGFVLIDLINYRKSEYLKPVEVSQL